MRVSLVQNRPVLGDTDGNLDRAATAIDRAVGEGADLVVFPELATSGYDLGDVSADLALSAADPRLTELSRGAGDAGVLLGFPEHTQGVHVYNSAAHLQGGRVVHCHRKLYLPTYDIFEERKHFSPGQHMRAYGTPHGRVATLICNDAWQPQLPFLAVQDGASVLLIPTNSAQSRFPERYDSESYWRDITTFYARMYQCYVVFVNRVGDEGQLRFWGGSHVVDPWGEIVAQAPQSCDALLTVDLDLTRVRLRRREVPLVKEARLGLVERECRRLVEEGGDL
jgi:predicted amidohydrolase